MTASLLTSLPARAATLRDDAAASAPSHRLVETEDRRASERVPLRRGALLELPGRRRIAVNLLDLSEGGAALQADAIDTVPGVVCALMLDTALLPATVVAVSDGRVHLAFQPLSPAAESVLRRLLGAMPERALAA